MGMKRNDGYVLPVVLVVLAVLALIATGLMTVTLGNMRSQEKQIERMEQQYQAQGKLEKVLAQMSFNSVVEISGAEAGSCEKAVQTIVQSFCGGESGVVFQEAEGTPLDYKGTIYEAPFTYQFGLAASDDTGKTTVCYNMQLAGRLARSEETAGVYQYIITAPQLTCERISVEVTG